MAATYVDMIRSFPPSLAARQDSRDVMALSEAGTHTAQRERDREYENRHTRGSFSSEETGSGGMAAHIDGWIRAEALTGLPDSAMVDGIKVRFGPHIPARRAAVAYCLSAGIPPDSLPTVYARADREKARRVACLYEDLEASPRDELTQASYQALAQETLAQWAFVKATGLRVEYNPAMRGEPDPYANPRRLILDVRQNNHLFVTATRSAYGDVSFTPDPLHPLLQEVAGERISGQVPLVNDILRIVHDFFGHTREGLGFRFEGEYNAWRSHRAMYSPLARRAMTVELLAQASWINHGPFGARNRCARMEETRFPPQKLGLLPEWVSDDWAEERRGETAQG